MNRACPEKKQELLHKSLLTFFRGPNLHIFLFVLHNKTNLSLRILDWLVTNYSKKNNVTYTLPDKKKFNLYLSYKAQLKAFSKKQFDPFCRRERLLFTPTHKVEDELYPPFLTTVGQLNFFRWAIQHGVLKYALDNLQHIENDMLVSIQHRYKKTKKSHHHQQLPSPPPPNNNNNNAKPLKKRKELSKNAAHQCQKTYGPISLTFH